MYNRGEIMTEEERLTLYNWITNDLWPKLKKDICNRLHYELNSREDPTIIPLVWQIKDRIIEREGLIGYKQEPTLKDFIAVIPKTGWIQKHIDRNIRELIHSRFNVFISSPGMGFNTYYDGNVVDTKERCYAFCRSGIDEHYTDVNNDDIPRISFSFGYILPFQKVDELTSDKTIGTYKFYPLNPIKKMYNRGKIITESERLILSDWVSNVMMSKVNKIPNGRYDTILLPSNSHIISLVWEVKNRIIEKEGLQLYKDDNLVRDFLGIVPNGAHIPKHRDENYKNYIHSRFNVFIQVPPDGCTTYYGGYIVDTKEGCYAFSRSGFDEHWTTVNTNSMSRVSLSFGFMLPKKKIDYITSDKSIGTYDIYPLYKPMATWDIGFSQPALFDISGTFYGSVLDAGSGFGDNSIWLTTLELVLQVTGIDIMGESIQESTNRAVINNIKKQLQFIRCNILEDTILQENSFDCLLDSALFHNFIKEENKIAYISKVTSLIKTGGKAVVIFFSDTNLDPWKGPLRINKENGINLWKMAGWDINIIKEVKYLTNWPEGEADAILLIATKII